jgi:Immunity protein 63
MVAVSTIKSRYYHAARRLGAPKRLVVFATQPRPDGGAYVERGDGAYAYVVWERGVELQRRITHDPDEVLYWLVSDLTFEMALEYELSHRRKHRDSRRLLFEKHLELLATVNHTWSERQRLEYDRTLQEHPFLDHRP